MANKTIHELNGVETSVADDEIAIWRQAEGDTRKIEKLDFIGATITGEGAIATGGFTITATGNATVNGAYEANADVTDAGNVGSSIHGASAKTTPVDADTMPLIDSAASNVLKKVTWANIKATLKIYFDTLYELAGAIATHAALTATHGATGAIVGTTNSQSLTNKTLDSTNISTLTSKTTPVNADSVVLVDSAASNVFKRVTYTNVKAFLKTYFDTLYGLLETANTWSADNTYTAFIKFSSSAKTISGGVITPTAVYTPVDTESAAASDNLDTITGVNGALIIIRAFNDARTVVIKDGTGNIRCPGDRTLSHSEDTWVGFYNGAYWCELSYSDNSA